jgi:tetratricopeptide (TPR) repeat protein
MPMAKLDQAHRWAALGLLVCIWALYLPSLGNEFIFDDHEVILAQPAPRSLGAVGRIFLERHVVDLPYYRPITRASLLVQRTIHGDHAAPFHVFNAGLMALISVVAYALLRLPVFGIRRGPALLAAALFGAHPVASACVHPIASGRETAMPALWMLAAVYAHLRGGTAWRITAHLAFAGALLCKEQAVVVPAVFLGADILRLTSTPAERSRRWWRVRYAPALAILLAYAWMRLSLFGGADLKLGSPLGPVWSFAYALQILFAPTVDLIYEPDLEVWRSIPRLCVAVVALASIAAAALRILPNARPVLQFWLGWFVLVQLPTANLLFQEAPFDERYVFLASLAPWAVLAMLASSAWERPSVRRAVSCAGLLLIALAGSVSVGRASFFADDETFFSHWHRVSPDSADANVHLGRVLFEQGRIDEAARHYRKAVELGPVYARAWLGLGLVRKAQGKLEEARSHYERALDLNPQLADGHFFLAVALEQREEIEQAIYHYREAVRLYPTYLLALINLGNLLTRIGEVEEAIHSYRRALQVEPELKEAHFNLASALSEQGQTEEAIAHYRRAIDLAPDSINSYLNLGVTLGRAGRLDEAARVLRRALEIEPGHRGARHNLRWIEQLRRRPSGS